MQPRAVAVLAVLLAGGVDMSRAAPPEEGTETRRGASALRAYGCGACHDIPGIAGARGNVGPPLGDVRSRAYLAGRLPNSPANLARWIEAPQRVLPGGAMPDMGVTREDARAMAAWLWREP